MFFRFGVALVLVVAIALLAAGIEKQNLAYRRLISHQRYQADVLKESQTRLRLEVQQLGAPVKLLEPLDAGRLSVQRPDSPTRKPPTDSSRVAGEAPSSAKKVLR